MITIQAINEIIITSIEKAKYYKGVKRIGIFGSYARGEQTNDSDIDILFDYYHNSDDDNGIDDTLQYLDELETDLNQYLGNARIDFVSYIGVMDSSSKKVRDNILNDVIWIYDSTIDNNTA